MNSIHPTEDQVKEFLAKQEDGPIVMINLLKFKRTDGDDTTAAEKQYERYMLHVSPMLEKVGGRLVWMADVDQVFIGTDADQWDRVLLVEYPSRAAFFQMISDPAYMKVHKDRELALENSALLPGKTIMGVF